VRVDHASPAQAQSAAPVRAPPRLPGLVASVDLQLRSVMIGLVRGERPPPLSSSAGGRATTQHARSLFVSIIARGTTQCATTLTTRNATRMCKIYVGLPPRTVREPVRPRVTGSASRPPCTKRPKAWPGTQGSDKGSVASETRSQSRGWVWRASHRSVTKNKPKAAFWTKCDPFCSYSLYPPSLKKSVSRSARRACQNSRASSIRIRGAVV